MDIFDSHCHLDDRSFHGDLGDVIRRANQEDVNAMMVVGVDALSSQKAVEIANQYDGLAASVGVHPHDAKGCDEKTMDGLCALASNPKVRAWGETGLDFNRMFSSRADQERWLIRQLELGGTLQLPMIFHERDSHGRFLEILRSHWAPGRSGVVHCFSGSPSDLEAYLDLGLYIGITGILTIHSRGQSLRQMVQSIPAERLLVETDAPYLTPTPQRNKFRRNEPAFVRTVLHKLADVRREPLEILAHIVWDNTCRLFGKL